MIQQQYYTRARGGIFLKSDGYDTVSISPSLDKNFVKKTIHSFCTYDPPAALARRREKDTTLYPEIITFFQPETGEIVIGKSVYVPADFTGQRSTYFVHNYVVPRSEKEIFIEKPEKLFRAKGFQTNYSADYPLELAELFDIPCEEGDAISERESLFSALGLNDQLFKELLFAVFSAATGKKKVFISLGCDVREYARYGMKLLELIAHYLPYPVRRRLGATTYSSAAESRKYIHVSFIERDILNSNSPELDKQYLFDLAAGSVTGVNISGQTHEFLELASAYEKSGRSMDEFFAFCEKALSGLVPNEELEMANYYSLAAIYADYKNQNTFYYKRNRRGMLSALLHFLSAETERKRELLMMFPALLAFEKRAEDHEDAPQILRLALDFSGHIHHHAVEQFIVDTLQYHLGKPSISGLWSVLEQDSVYLSGLLNHFDEENLEEHLASYLSGRFGPLTRLEDILNQLRNTLELAPPLAESPVMAGWVLNKLGDVLEGARTPFDTVIETIRFVQEMKQSIGGISRFTEQVEEFMLQNLLQAIDSRKVTIKEIEQFTLLFGQKPPSYKKELNSELMSKVSILEVLSAVIRRDISDFDKLSWKEQEQAREALRNILSKKMGKADFPLVALAFDADGVPIFADMLRFISKQANNELTMDFIHWAVFQYRDNEALLLVLKNYLSREGNPIWENKEYRSRLKKIRQLKFRDLIKEIEYEKANAVGKIFKRLGSKLR
ncbi:hypothetical protein A8F94_09645 [Bacillus sp. FJAT-27225]|uniref:GAP1-N2 domain-containing protein n=1 Tax=Bacillus sp. FJAT-27225 TaxID=1743144 RepID=UPI00080C30FC|nr:hypothetical protein [Bacillus sp. FJAT-27225]OCA88072.1 hypothetical protein A8F94_09645 [Bacillus sp. FJAT-27225]